MRTGVQIKTRHYLHNKLKRKLYIYLGIFFVMLILCIYDILAGYINALEATLGWCIGIIIGYASARAAKLIWHEETESVITHRDTIGIIVLVLYLALSFSRKWILHHWIHGNELTAFAFCLVAGGRFGRIWSIRRKVKKVLREQGIL